MTTETPLKLGALYQVTEPAEDLERAIAFYRDTLGLPFVAKFDPPGLAFFDLGGTRLMLSAIAEEETARPGSPLYFAVDDIEAATAALEARGVTIESGPHPVFKDEQGVFGPAGAEEWMAFFRDTEGNLLALVASRES